MIHDTTSKEPQTTTDTNPIHPFSAVSVSDVDHNAQDGATITLSNGANGTLSGTGLSTTNISGVYTIAATSPQTLTSDLQSILFTPATPPAGGSTTTNFSLSVSDGIAPAASDTNISVVDTATYTPTDHAYSPTLQNTSGNTIGGRPGMEIDASNSGVLEFGVSNIGTHPITSATLDTQEIGFLAAGNDPFDVSIYAFSGTGAIASDLTQVGTLVGTGQMGRSIDLFDVNLNPSALNQVLSHGSDLAFRLVAGTTNGSAGALDTGISGIENADGFHLHLTA